MPHLRNADAVDYAEAIRCSTSSHPTPVPRPSPTKRIKGCFWQRFNELIVSCNRRLGAISGLGGSGSLIAKGHPSSSKQVRIISWFGAGTLNCLTTTSPSDNSRRSLSQDGFSVGGWHWTAECCGYESEESQFTPPSSKNSRRNTFPVSVNKKHDLLRNFGPTRHSNLRSRSLIDVVSTPWAIKFL